MQHRLFHDRRQSIINGSNLSTDEDKLKQLYKELESHGNIEIIEKPLRKHKRNKTDLFESKNKRHRKINGKTE